MQPHLCTLSVAGTLDLALTLLRKRDAENTQGITIRGFNVHVRLNQRLPLADE